MLGMTNQTDETAVSQDCKRDCEGCKRNCLNNLQRIQGEMNSLIKNPSLSFTVPGTDIVISTK